MRRGAIALAALALTSAVRFAHADGDASPYEAIRTLQRLQDRIAVGDTAAQTAHVKAIRRTTELFASAKLSTWSEQRNARALILYLFSGGDAAAIDHAVPRSALPSNYQALYDGALAYGLGNDDKARLSLMPIEARSLPSGLGGHLALVQAILAAPADQTKALALLDLARLLEPGTLIEEAALRKEMSLIGSTGDLDKFALLARRYLSGFSRSIYAENFRQLIAQTAMQLGAGDDAASTKKLTGFVNDLEPAERRRLYFAIAYEALVSGRTRMAAVASEEARRLAAHGGPDEARAMVYFGAATIVDARYEQGIAVLKSAPSDKLGVADRALRESALAIADSIHRPIGAAKDAGAAGPAQPFVLSDGERALVASEAMMKNASR